MLQNLKKGQVILRSFFSSFWHILDTAKGRDILSTAPVRGLRSHFSSLLLDLVKILTLLAHTEVTM